ncbi:MAG: hypothetical protein ACR2IS_03570 [Nitrososphaeraceae archaeon]
MESVNIFVSSKTTEFAEEREKIKSELEGLDKSITAFIFEDDARPSSTKSDEVYRYYLHPNYFNSFLVYDIGLTAKLAL